MLISANKLLVQEKNVFYKIVEENSSMNRSEKRCLKTGIWGEQVKEFNTPTLFLRLKSKHYSGSPSSKQKQPRHRWTLTKEKK